MIELNEGQKRAVAVAVKRIRDHEICTCISGPAGTGKAQPVYTKIPTPTGEKKMGDLKVGDFVFNEHGKPVKVIGVFPQGQKEIYEVQFRDGRKTECCSEHLWTVRVAGLKNLRTLTAKQILDSGLYHDMIPKFKIPLLNNPVEYEAREEDNKTTDYYAVGLNLAFCGKRIPEKYKLAPVEARREFVRGLMDYYGSVREDEENHIYRVRFDGLNNYDLTIDMREMLFSLGYISRINSTPVNFVCVGAEITYYYLSIDVPNEEIHKLFKNSSYLAVALKAKEKETIKDYSMTSITNIKPTGKYTEMLCIKVDSPTELYLTNDFIVTHNTSVVRFIIDELGLQEDEVAFAAFTGKAAQVLQKKGNKNAMTLHKLLYKWEYDKFARCYVREKREYLGKDSENPYKLIVVDEISMAPKELMDELFSYDIPCLCLGDESQLPPVSNSGNNHILDTPHARLTEIMRQEGESEIIQIATKIRLGGSLEPFRGKEVQVIHRDELTTGMMKWADQMLCARNETRNSLNAQMRRIYGFTGLPRRGDKIICLRNYWHRHTEDGNVLINGTIATIEDYVRSRAHIKTKNRFYPSFDYYNTKIRTETNELFDNIILDINKIATGEPRFSTDERMDILRSKSSFLLPYDFTYAYAITVWKAQGSEWDKVLLFEEDFPYNKEEKRKFIYTGITRAAKKLIVVLNN